MRLPKFKDDAEQRTFWEDSLGGHGHVRTIIGDFAELLTVRLISGRRYRTDCTADYCPDLFALDSYFEVKAAGRSNQTFIYEGRLERDAAFAKQYPLFYVIWHHGANTLHASTPQEVRYLFLKSLKTVYFIPFSEIYDLSDTLPVEKLNSKYGGSDTNPRYGAGYRINIKDIKHKTNHLAFQFKPSTSLF